MNFRLRIAMSQVSLTRGRILGKTEFWRNKRKPGPTHGELPRSPRRLSNSRKRCLVRGRPSRGFSQHDRRSYSRNIGRMIDNEKTGLWIYFFFFYPPLFPRSLGPFVRAFRDRLPIRLAEPTHHPPPPPPTPAPIYLYARLQRFLDFRLPFTGVFPHCHVEFRVTYHGTKLNNRRPFSLRAVIYRIAPRVYSFFLS